MISRRVRRRDRARTSAASPSSILHLLSSCLCLVAAGCAPAVIGALIHKVSPPPLNEPVCILAKVPTLVWVENYESPGQDMADSEQIARYIAEDLATADKKELVPIIPTAKAYDLRSLQPTKFTKMKISEIGGAVGAQQVIYVDMEYSDIVTVMGSEILRGRAAGLVKVIDVKSAVTTWPQESSGGYPTGFETKLRRPGEGATKLTVREEMLDGFGKKVGRLFHSWRAEE